MTSNDTGDRGTGRTAHWLIVERYENWVVDRARGFATLGFPERMKKRASQLRAGDLLFVYVSSGELKAPTLTSVDAFVFHGLCVLKKKSNSAHSLG